MLFGRLVVTVRKPLRCFHPQRSPRNYRSRNNPFLSSGYKEQLQRTFIKSTALEWTQRRLRGGQRTFDEADKMASGGRKVVNPSSLTNCHLQVIGTGNCEVGPSLCLVTDSRRYIFNCGENFQRLVREYRKRFLKEPVFFITRVSWKNLGGLPGTAMSNRDAGMTQLHIHGPRRIAEFAEVTRYFIGREKLKLITNWESASTDNTTPPPYVYSDENVTITTVELEPQLFQDDVSSLDDCDVTGKLTVPEPKRVKHDGESLLSPSTAAFVCKLVDTKGKFNLERAKELGLKPGPIYKKLVEGESVTTPDGRVIHPSDVIGAKQIGPTFIVVECPNRHYIPSVVSHSKLQKDYFTSIGQEVVLIVHLSPIDVLQDDSYCQWSASFGASTRHLIVNETVCPREVGLRGLTKVQYPLHLMNPNVHHPPPNIKDEVVHVDLKLSHLLPNPDKDIIIGRCLLKFHLKPVRKIGEDTADVLRPLNEDIAERIHEIQSNPKLASAIAAGQVLTNQSDSSCIDPTSDMNSDPIETNTDHASTRYESINSTTTSGKDSKSLCLEPRPLITTFQGPDDAIITFLGTGSACPSKYRNVSGILLQTKDSGNLLLDCGEGTLSQIYCCFPQELANRIILDLKAIFISHIHGDHHLGLVSILQKKKELLTKWQKLPTSNSDDTLVIAPKYNIQWMSTYSELIEKLSYRTLDCSSLVKKQVQKTDPSTMGDFRFETVPVIHCSEAYGVVVRHTSGWSVVYSGDTRPCPALIEAGRGSTLLIHEATLEDRLLDHAIDKKHCTLSEALKVSNKMNAGFTILTHFSQRYPMIPSFLMADKLHSRVAIAFDCMSVNLKQVNQLHKYLPGMRDIFAEVVDPDSEDLELGEQTSFLGFAPPS